MFIIKISLVILLTWTLMNGATSMIHTAMEFRTSSTQVPNFPEYVIVGVVNGLPIYYYDSKTKREVPKQEWMNRVTEEDPQFWDKNTQMDMYEEQLGKVNMETIRQRLNQTEGLHIWQRMAGCEWDDETNEIRGIFQYAFDGEDFISLDWETQTWVAAKPQAFATKLNWERAGEAARVEQDVTYRCAKWLKKFVRFGEKTLKRKELPRVSFLQKSSSSPVTCHATGFYPEGAMLFWTKDGEELWGEEVEYWGVLPNPDGTFQRSADLDLTSVPTGDWSRYSCVFQLSGVKDDIIYKLDPALIRTNKKKDTPYFAAVAGVLVAVVCAVIGCFVYHRFYKAKQLTSQSSEPEVMQELNPPTPETHITAVRPRLHLFLLKASDTSRLVLDVFKQTALFLSMFHKGVNN